MKILYFDIRGKIVINRVNWLLKNIFNTLIWYVIWFKGRDKIGEVELWMLCVNEKVEESGHIRLQTFRENLSRRMRKVGSGSFIEIMVLDVE
jgi:hypothetical protein